MEETEFNDKYWHTNTKIVTVVNPRTEDYVFQAASDVGIDTSSGKMKTEIRHYRVPGGGNERFPGPIANMYLDQMSKLIAQDEDKIQFMIDYALKAQYYDQLIVSIEDLINSFQPSPEYLDKPKPEAKTVEETVPEEPFAAAKQEVKRGRPPKVTTEA